MKNLYIICVILCHFIIVVLFPCKSTAQKDFIKKFYSTDNGLAHNTVQDICQDKTGFIWVATWDGLSRYDGYEFKNYYYKPKDSLSFPFFNVWKVLVNKSNKLLIQCDKRPMVTYNRSNNNFEFLKGIHKNIPFYDTYIDADNNTWSMDQNYIYQFNDSMKVQRKIRFYGLVKNKEEWVYSYQITKDNQNNIWVAGVIEKEFRICKSVFTNDSTLIFKDINSSNINISEASSLHKELGRYNVAVSKNNETFLFTKFGLFIYDVQRNEFLKYYSIPDPEDFNNTIPYLMWMTDSTGINVIDLKQKQFFRIPQEPGCLFEIAFIDKHGIIWAGAVSENSYKSGLYKYIPVPGHFCHYLMGPGEEGKQNIISAIFKDKNNHIWVGTRQKNYLMHLKPDGSKEKVLLINHPNIETQPILRTITGDKDGFWMGCTNDYLLKYNYNSKKIEPYISGIRSLPSTIPFLGIHNILTRNNSILINGNFGIYEFEKSTKKLEMKYLFSVPGICHSFMPDDNGGYWLGIWANSVLHIDNEFKFLNDYAKIGNGENLVEHVCVGDSSDLWLALMGGGLGHLYPKTKKHEILTTTEGLANNTLYSILKDNKGNLWISSNKGISRFNPKTRQFRNYDAGDGLLIEEFNSDSWFQAEDGEMFFGGVGGLVSFYPDSVLKYDNFENKLILNDIQVSGEPMHFDKPVYELDTFRLRKGDNNFRATFGCINFTDANRINYRYRLLGENDNWVETDYRNRNINYTNLTHKNYRLEIEATNRQGEWAFRKTALIVIPHKFHETNLFRISLILLVFGLSMLTIRLYVNQVKLKEKQKQEELKLESLRGQMNPHFLFNALNSINYFISNNDKLSANYYIADFSRLIRTFLNNLSHEYVSLESELQLLKDYLNLEHLRFRDKFDFELVTNNIEDPAAWKIYPGMIQPFIENAIWHGVRNLEARKGIIKVTFEFLNPEQLRCVVEDDGVGRNHPIMQKTRLPGKKSRGISIVLDRLRIYNNLRKKDFKVVIEDAFPEKPETGTRVIIDVPVLQGKE